MSEATEALGLIAPSQRLPIPGDGPQTAAAVLDGPLAASPEHTALVGRSGRYTFAELEREVNRAAHAFSSLGIQPGDRIAACLPNDVHIAIAFLASQRLGAIWLGINRPLAPPEKVYMLANSEARLLVTDAKTAKSLEAHRSEISELESLQIVDPARPDAGWLGRVAAAPVETPRPDIEIDPFAPSAIAYTSGTTGFPKGAVHSQHNLMLVATVLNRTGALPPEITVGVLLPLTILNLCIRAPLAAWLGGRTLVCIDRIDPEGIAEWVRGEKVGTMDTVPTVVRDLLTDPNVSRSELASLVDVVIGGADCPPEVVELYRERFGGGVTIGYGMTEAPTGVARTSGEAPRGAGHCGLPIPQVELFAVDEDDRVLPPGETGELCVVPASSGEYKGVYTPMLGYWKKPEATREALRNGRYHTGDLGTLDTDGHVYIRGRRNELILRGGSNVYPAEIERVLQLHPAVALAAVLGIADERLGERVVAAVQLTPGAAVNEEELRAHVQENLARYKVPDHIIFVAEIPRNSMQKLMKRDLLPLFVPAT